MKESKFSIMTSEKAHHLSSVVNKSNKIAIGLTHA